MSKPVAGGKRAEFKYLNPRGKNKQIKTEHIGIIK
jgi:hypothetical protein